MMMSSLGQEASKEQLKQIMVRVISHETRRAPQSHSQTLTAAHVRRTTLRAGTTAAMATAESICASF